jgi:hypothetical protein
LRQRLPLYAGFSCPDPNLFGQSDPTV